MGVDITKMELTPCTVKFNNIDLGGTIDNVEVTVETQKAPLLADQFGKTELDGRVSGHVVKVKTKLTEVQTRDNWIVAFPFATKESGSPSGDFIQYSNKVGSAYYAAAKALILHPKSMGAAKTMDWNFGKAIAQGVSPFVFGPEEQQGLEVEFVIYPDTTSENFFKIGDPALMP